MLMRIYGRCSIILIIFLSGFATIGIRLFYLGNHRIDFERFIRLARQRVRTIPASRGSIIDRKGRPLVLQQNVYDVGVDLTQIQERDKVHLPQLARLLNYSLSDLKAIWQKSDCQWKSLSHDVSQAVYKKIKQLSIRGVYGNERSQRRYLHAPSLSYVVGFINKENQPVGGIEKMMQFYLSGQEGYIAYEVNGKNEEMLQYRQEKIEPVGGCTIELTIDNQVQGTIERILIAAAEKYQAQSVQALVTQPHTGEVLALVHVPFFDSNRYHRYSNEILTNKALSDVYEPGSVFKAIVISAALDCNAVHVQDSFNCGLSKARYRGKLLPLPKDWKDFNQTMTVPEILSHSSNRGTIQIGLKLGADRLYEYGKRFGFTESTRVGFAGETNGIFHPVKNWDGLTITRLPMGHGLACSIFQMHYAMSVIANGGLLMYPQVVRRIYNANGDIVRTIEPKVRRRVLSKVTAKTMRELLLLTSKSKAFMPYYAVAGKTGTTQKIVNGQYSHSQHIASFSGFFPNPNPQIHVTVTVDSPHISGTAYGSVVAAPIFKEIAENLVAHLGISPNFQRPLL